MKDRVTGPGRPRVEGGLRLAADIERTLDLTALGEERWTRIEPAFAIELIDRVFTAGLQLAAASCLLGRHEASGKLEVAIAELDQLIRHIRAGVYAATS